MQGAAQAAQERFKGQQANANEIKRTTELTLAQDKENTTNSVDTTNDNRYNAWNAALLRSQAKQGYINKRQKIKISLLLSFRIQHKLDKMNVKLQMKKLLMIIFHRNIVIILNYQH